MKTLGAYREKFDELFKKIDREGDDKLYNYLSLQSDFFTAPASSQYHLNIEGGLMIHSVNVAITLITLNEVFKTGFSESTLIVCSLLHDICKANYYVKDFKNVKENGVWVQKPTYIIKDKFPMGHSEKSVVMIMTYMKLSPEEMLAIRYHMGKWDLADSQIKSMNAAYDYTKLVSLVQLADVAATHLLEDRT
jgi:hypothetical protein